MSVRQHYVLLNFDAAAVKIWESSYYRFIWFGIIISLELANEIIT